MKNEFRYLPQYGYKGIVFTRNGAVDVAFSYVFTDVVKALLPFKSCDVAIKDKFGLRRISKEELMDFSELLGVRSNNMTAEQLDRFRRVCDKLAV